MTQPYLVRSDGNVVETWSVKRLPFEPKKNWEREWRDELKEKLRQVPGGFLAARYDSPVRDYRCDAENILFYNLSGAFSTSTCNGLRFERGFSRQPCPVELSGPANHYHRYSAAQPREPFDGWTETRLLAEFGEVQLPWLKFDSNPALVWFPLRQAAVERHPRALAESPFAFRLRLEAPSAVGAAAALAKCLFDGVISRFQAHDGWRSDEIATWMAGRFGFEDATVGRLLTDGDDAVLGRRRLFNARGAGFQWAPDDDLCVAGEIEVVRSPGWNGGGFRLSGALSAVATKHVTTRSSFRA